MKPYDERPQGNATSFNAGEKQGEGYHPHTRLSSDCSHRGPSEGEPKLIEGIFDLIVWEGYAQILLPRIAILAVW